MSHDKVSLKLITVTDLKKPADLINSLNNLYQYQFSHNNEETIQNCQLLQYHFLPDFVWQMLT